MRRTSLLLIAVLTLAYTQARADSIQPIVRTGQVLYGSSQKIITSTSNVTIDTTTNLLTAAAGIKTSTVTFRDGTIIYSTANFGGSGVWGSITGTLSSQSDLQSVLNTIGVATGTHTTQINALGVSTGTLQTQANAIAVATGTIQAQFPVSLSTGVAGQLVVKSSATVYGTGGMTVTYNMNVGSMTGAGLASCGDASHSLAFTSSNTFACQYVTGPPGNYVQNQVALAQGASFYISGYGQSSSFFTAPSYLLSNTNNVITDDGHGLADTFINVANLPASFAGNPTSDVCIGAANTCRSLTSASQSTCVGNASCLTMTSGGSNTAVGYESGGGLTTGSQNTFIGYLSGYGNGGVVTGTNNTGVGQQSGVRLTSGSYNTFVGNGAGNDITTGQENTCIGDTSCNNIIVGSSNTALGYGTVTNYTNNQGMTYVGAQAGAGVSSMLTYGMALGYGSVVSASNTAVMGGAAGTYNSLNLVVTTTTVNFAQATTSSITYQLQAGSMTGAGLTTCGDSTHAIGWSATNNLFTCQNVTGSAPNGAFSLVVTTGTSAGYAGPPISSFTNTTTIVFDSSTTNGKLLASSTYFFTLSPSSVTLQGNAFNSANQLVQTNGSGQYPALNGNLITNINANSITPSIIFNQNTLQAGASFYVLSGTSTLLYAQTLQVSSNVYASSIAATNLQVSGPSVSTFTYGVAMGSATVYGPGNGIIVETISQSSYAVTSSSVNIVVGNMCVFTSTNGTLGNGGTGGGGAGNPAGSNTQLQYNNAGSFGGVANTSVSASSITMATIVGISTLNVTGNAAQLSTNTVLLVGTTTAFLQNGMLGVGTTTPFVQGGINASEIRSPLLINAQTGDPLTNVQNTDPLNVFVRSNAGLVKAIAEPANISAGFAVTGPDGYPKSLLMMANEGSTAGLFNNEKVNDVELAFTTVNSPRMLIGVVNSSATVMIDTNSHVNFEGNNSPIVSACGTSPSISSLSRDNAGVITTGSGSPTSCTITFRNQFLNPPVCVISDSLTSITPDISAISKTAVTFSFSAALNSGQIYYICIGND